MKPKLAVVFLIIVIAPLAVLAWLGARFARVEQEMIAHRFEEVAADRLREIDGTIASVIAERERELAEVLSGPDLGPEKLRSMSFDSPIVNQFFLIDAENELAYPDLGSALSQNEEEFLQRTAELWSRGAVLAGTPAESPGKVVGLGGTHGWYAWHWGDGLHLLYWQRGATGGLAGAELNRSRLTADIIAELPDTAVNAAGSARYVVADSAGRPVYQWGLAAEGEEDAEPLATIPVSGPLATWRLEYYPAEPVPGGLGRGVLFNIGAGLLALVAATVLLAAYFYREHSREMREAQQRVTFTNQVSHELKTPLTNIRMYAELLDQQVDESDEKGRKYLAVIQSESQRLSRLIGNVLSFGRSRREGLTVHPVEGVVDETVRSVCEHFEPALKQKGIQIRFEGHASGTAAFDRDALEQILGNLLNNVEKYARDADEVRVETNQNGDRVTITVTDNGSGIPARERERVFEPFHRVSNKLTDGVAGAGIGLPIARELARRHGGDVTLEATERGARFRVAIRAAAWGNGAAS